MFRHPFSIDSDMNLVPGLAGRIRAACDLMNITESDATTIEICVVEAVNNAIEHAYGERSGSAVDVLLTLDGDRFVVEVRDTGSPLPEGRLERARSLEPREGDLGSLPERGMGLAILKAAMDEVAYASEGGTNTLSLSRRVALSPRLASTTVEEST